MIGIAPSVPMPGRGQRGQAALLTVLLVFGIAGSVMFYMLTTPASATLAANKRTEQSLAQAREALIGYAAAATNRPGAVPCPDTDNDGSANGPAVADGTCTSYVGRLPWRTLGLADVRDGAGERLWYAMSPVFRNWPTTGATFPGVLNSDTPGVITIDGGAIPVIAIVIAPGSVHPGQSREAANENDPRHYLECGNQDLDSAYVTTAAGCELNDQLLSINSDALFNVVNVRVAKEAIRALELYRTTNAYYPDANAYTNGTPYSCTAGLYRGRIPLNPVGCGRAAWGTSLPSWFSNNNWNLVTHYAVSKACGRLGLGSINIFGVPVDLDAIAALMCVSEATLDLVNLLLSLAFLPPIGDEPVSVTGISTNVQVLVMVSGRATGAQVHSCANATNCLEDTNNRNGEAGDANGAAVYVKPSRFPASNDHLALTCAAVSPCAVYP